MLEEKGDKLIISDRFRDSVNTLILARDEEAKRIFREHMGFSLNVDYYIQGKDNRSFIWS